MCLKQSLNCLIEHVQFKNGPLTGYQARAVLLQEQVANIASCSFLLLLSSCRTVESTCVSSLVGLVHFCIIQSSVVTNWALSNMGSNWVAHDGNS